jgi:AcrR family transcriptional regulator
VQRIMDAALACFSRAGYHGTSLKEIAAEAGVAKSLVHYHFESKEHLLVELQAEYYRRLARQTRDWLSRQPPSVESAWGALEQVWSGLEAGAAQMPFALEVWRASMVNPDIKARLEGFEREMVELVHEGVITALGPLAARLPVPPDRFARLLDVLLHGFGLRLCLSANTAEVRRSFEDLKLLIRAALGLSDGGATEGGAR